MSQVEELSPIPESTSAWYEDLVRFPAKFVRNTEAVATLIPTGRFLAAAHCRCITPEQPQVILELGAGTGAITTQIIRRMHRDSQLIAIEIDPDFADVLKRRCPEATIVLGDVGDLPRHLDALGVEKIDLMVCALALPMLTRETNRGIFSALADKGGDATFVQLTLIPWVYRWIYSGLFHDVDLRIVPLNFPPGGVNQCSRLRENYGEYLVGRAEA